MSVVVEYFEPALKLWIIQGVGQVKHFNVSIGKAGQVITAGCVTKVEHVITARPVAVGCVTIAGQDTAVNHHIITAAFVPADGHAPAATLAAGHVTSAGQDTSTGHISTAGHVVASAHF